MPNQSLLTFEQLKTAYAPFGLHIEKENIYHHASPVKVVYDSVPYTIDCRHKLDDISACVTSFRILLERHHNDIKRLYNTWQALGTDPLHVAIHAETPLGMFPEKGGPLELLAFFSTSYRIEGILCLSLIDDGQFQEMEHLLGGHGVSFTPYKPDEELLKGPHPLKVSDYWLKTLPVLDNIQMYGPNDKVVFNRKPSSPVAATAESPKTPNPYGEPKL